MRMSTKRRLWLDLFARPCRERREGGQGQGQVETDVAIRCYVVRCARSQGAHKTTVKCDTIKPLLHYRSCTRAVHFRNAPTHNRRADTSKEFTRQFSTQLIKISCFCKHISSVRRAFTTDTMNPLETQTHTHAHTQYRSLCNYVRQVANRSRTRARLTHDDRHYCSH